MKVLQGRQVIGQAGEVSVVADWGDILYYGGGLDVRKRAENLFGQILKYFGYALVALSVFLPIINSELNIDLYLVPGNAFGIMWWLGWGVYAYSLYLRRDFGEFAFNLEQSDLHQLMANLMDGKLKQVELDNYLSIEVWSLIDQVYNYSPQAFLTEFAKELLKKVEVKEILFRLGVHSTNHEQLVKSLESQPQDLGSNLDILHRALLWGLQTEAQKINSEVMFMVMSEKFLMSEFLKLGVPKSEFAATKMWLTNRNKTARYRQTWQVMSLVKPKGTVNRAYTSRYAPTLEQFGQDYTLQAATGDFQLSIGKEEQMKQVLRIMQQQASNCIVTGEPGVGKTHFLKHLAVRMVVEDVPKTLQDKRLVAFDLAKAFTASSTLENFKVVLQSLFEEVADSGDIILVLDNLDLALDVRNDLQAEIVNTINSALEKYRIRMIATASTNGYNRFIKAQRSLASRLQVVSLPQPEAATALQILIDVAATMEQKSGIKFELPALRQIVNLAPKFDHDRVLPDKGVAMMEEALFEAQEQELNSVSADIIDKIVSKKVGVSVGKLSESEAARLMDLEKELHERVIGQQQAIKAVANALRRARAGLNRGSKPVASFLFFGPTGVGKTEVARTLAFTYYGAEQLMVRIDMSEYQESENLKRLIGAEENGEFIGGQLTEAVRKKPFSLVLFDEVEKANPKVLDLLLQILDEGSITDGTGRKIDFTNTIIILTSNAGSRQIAELIGQGKRYHEVYNEVLPSLRKIFRVEFLNRFDQVIMFKPLTPVEIQQIADKMLQALQDKLLDQGYHFTYTKDVVSELTKLGYDPVYGARQMYRTIQDHVENKVAAAIVQGQLQPGGNFNLDSIEG